MRRTLPLLYLPLLCALALAQAGPTRESLFLKGTCGPAFVQEEFVSALLSRLGEEFGERRASEMLGSLRAGGLAADEVVSLMNGKVSKGRLDDLLGLRSERPEAARAALDGAVAEKDKRILFGALLRTMVAEGDVDPSSDFVGVVRSSRAALSGSQFDRLCRGDVSTSFMRECFGFKSKDDQKAMQDYLNATWSSPYLLHPLAASLAGRRGLEGTFDAARFPEPAGGMPGYEEKYKAGEAGGLPFDKDLPPVPYDGDNLKTLFAK